nr:carboxypeptidase-like regulatory domain-containing protein [uncultured Flavobacterium sp.]
MKQCFILLLLYIGVTANAQELKGILKDADTKEGIPFVNVGVMGKNVGTVSAEDGRFAISIPAGHENDTLRVSTLGYANRDFIVKDFVKAITSNEVVLLKPESIKLDEVVVSNKKPKQKTLGSGAKSKSMTLGFTSEKLGNELGALMKIKGSPTKLLKFTAQVTSSDNPPAKMRLNFYSKTKKGNLPDALLTTENIIVTLPKNAEPLVVDLTKYNIMVEDDFYVTLEWLQDIPSKVRFSAGFMGPTMVARDTSQGGWEKINSFTVGFTVDTLYW